MGQVYQIGLQTGKNVTKAVDEIITVLHIDEMRHFDPDNRKTLKDGSTIYQWETNWNPLCEEAKLFLNTLEEFKDNNCKNMDDAWKLILINDENAEAEYYGNDAGYEFFDELYNPCEIHFPESFEGNSEKPIFTHNEAAYIVECFDNVLTRYGIKVPSPEDNEREEDNQSGLYGSVYDELLEKTEWVIKDILKRKANGAEVVEDIFSGE